MQTIYCKTSNFIRHEGNVVDLMEYRRKMTLAQAGPDYLNDQAGCAYESEAFGGQVRSSRSRTRRARARRAFTVLDCAASITLVLMAACFALKILL